MGDGWDEEDGRELGVEVEVEIPWIRNGAYAWRKCDWIDCW